MRHRHGIALPFLLLALVTLVGGLVNGVDARGRVVDDFSDKAIANATITHGVRSARSDVDGQYLLPDVPRTSRLRIDASGYLRTGAPPTQEEIRMSPLSVTIYVTEEGKAPPDNGVMNPEARRGDTRLITGTASGQITVVPHPGHRAVLLICAEGYQSKEITVEGVLMEITVARGGTGCPPLPSPSPAPGATPSPTAPAPSPSPSPAPSPSPTASP